MFAQTPKWGYTPKGVLNVLQAFFADRTPSAGLEATIYMPSPAGRPGGYTCVPTGPYARAIASSTMNRRSCPQYMSSPTKNVGAPNTPR